MKKFDFILSQDTGIIELIADNMSRSLNPFVIFWEMGFASFLSDFGRYLAATTIITAIIWYLMRTSLRTRKIQKRYANWHDIRREFLQSVRTCFVYVGVTVLLVWGINCGYLENFRSSLGWHWDMLALAGIIIAHDSYFYWVHRGLHHPMLFKRFHLAHHRSITPTPFAAYSFSVGEAVLMGAYVTLWQIFVPTPAWVLLTFLIFQITRNAMGHAGFEFMPRWWLSTPLTRWINTTTHHDLHHSGRFEHNYGLYFTFWDRMMGTEHKNYHAKFREVVGYVEKKADQSHTVLQNRSLMKNGGAYGQWPAKALTAGHDNIRSRFHPDH